MKKIIVSLFIMLFGILGSTSYALAEQFPYIAGKPAALDTNSGVGYFIWNDDTGFHVQTASYGTKHEFTGTITTDGKIENIFGKFDSQNGSFNLDKSNKVTFSFTDNNNTAGMDFHLKNASFIKFNLLIDGVKAESENISLGKDNWHPGNSEFTIQTMQNEESDSNRHVIVVLNPWFYDDWGGYPGPVFIGHPVHRFPHMHPFPPMP